MLPLSLIINICSIFGGGIAFGRPHSVIIICIIGFITLPVVYFKLPGLFNWTDRLFSLISALAVNVEGIWGWQIWLIPQYWFFQLRVIKIWFFYQWYYIYSAIHLSLFEIYRSLEKRIIKCIFVFIVLNVLHVVFVYILCSAYIIKSFNKIEM
jgi:hypothetical protein